MNAVEEVYADAIQQTTIARKYATNVQYWRIILETLYEEDPSKYTAGELKRHERDIIRRMNRNLRMANKVQRGAEKALRRYNQLKRKENLNGN